MERQKLNELILKVIVWDDYWPDMSLDLLYAFNKGELTDESFDAALAADMKQYAENHFGYADDVVEELTMVTGCDRDEAIEIINACSIELDFNEDEDEDDDF